MIDPFQNQTVVITGASGGIGQETARKFAGTGARIILHANRSVEFVRKISDEIIQSGGKSDVFVADFSKPSEVEQFYRQVDSSVGHVDILIHAAGVDLMSDENRSASFERKLSHLLSVDVVAPTILSKHWGSRMKDRRSGSIVFLGWDGVDYGWSGNSAELYGISKGAILGFSRSLAESLSPEVRVRCLALGWIKTRWGEKTSDDFERRVSRDSLQERWGTPQEVAEAIFYLTSPGSAYFDGINIRFNGGKRGTRLPETD